MGYMTEDGFAMPGVDPKIKAKQDAKDKIAADAARTKAAEDAKNSVAAQEARDVEAGFEGATDKNVAHAKGVAEADRLIGDGLYRAGDDEDVQGILDTFKDQAQGLSAKENRAIREKSIQGISSTAQSQSRGLLAKFASAGIKGGAAGAGLRDVALGAVSQRRQAENDLLIQNVDYKIRGAAKYGSALSSVKAFDDAQDKTELSLRSAYGTSGEADWASAEGLASQERIAQINAKALNASNDNSGGGK